MLTMSRIAPGAETDDKHSIACGLRLPGLPDNCNILNFRDYDAE